MANIKAVLVGEYIVALGFSSWAALKTQQAPWPPTVIKTSIAFSILGILSFATDELAATLGAGFLLAQLIKVLNKQPPYTGGVPDKITFSDTGKQRIAIMPSNTHVSPRTVLSWKAK